MYHRARTVIAELAFWCAAGMLVPCLVWQGRQVRRHTPRLPEPEGQRECLTGQETTRILLLGDSAAAGVGASHQSEALLGQLVKRMPAQSTIGYRLLAKTGDASSDVLTRLQTAEADAPSFDLVVISVGVNDVTGFTSLARWRRTLCSIRQSVEPTHLLFTQVPPMHHFPALPQPLRWLLGWRARQLNAVLNQTLEPDQILNVRIPFDEAYMASDGFHPGPSGYEIWADEVLRRIR